MAFVISLFESIISRLAMSEISIFQLVSVDGQAGLILTLSETPKTGGSYMIIKIMIFF